MLHFERQQWNRGLRRVAGVDEAGRGPLAGPVVAAVVVFDRAFLEAEEVASLSGLTDSKKLSKSRRKAFFDLLTRSPHVESGVGIADREEIDRLNILRATHLAMFRAVSALWPLPGHVLVDGLPVCGLPCPSSAITGGDGKSLSIAAASIIAKVTRDAMMERLDVAYPQYGFARHKGYGTQAHMKALLEYGPSEVHRMSFRPVREAGEIRMRWENDGERETS